MTLTYDPSYGPIYAHYRAPMLDRMEDKRVFSIGRREGKALIWELCDEYFVDTMTTAELRQLAAELIAVADDIDAGGVIAETKKPAPTE